MCSTTVEQPIISVVRRWRGDEIDRGCLGAYNDFEEDATLE